MVGFGWECILGGVFSLTHNTTHTHTPTQSKRNLAEIPWKPTPKTLRNPVETTSRGAKFRRMQNNSAKNPDMIWRSYFRNRG